jgi:DNA ligase (NAD+)
MMEQVYTPDQLDDLENHLEQWLTAYEIGNPEIEDDQYDHYKRLLQKLRPNSEFLTKIGNKPKRNKETLPYVLGSLTNYFEDNIQNWLNEFLEVPNGCPGFILSHKLDGVAIECEYDDGKLTGAWLRGDHYVGENIIHKAIIFAPKFLKPSRGKIYLKGEILFKPEVDYIKLGYKNRRNGVAGVINKDDLSLLKYLYIRFHTWANPTDFNQTYIELQRLNLIKAIVGEDCTVPYVLVEDVSKILEVSTKMLAEETTYDKDGIVIAANWSEVENVKLPTNKIAFKFNKMSAEAEVETVEWETSRTGKIIPVVKFKPITLGGATIQRATGFHAKFIYENSIGTGAIIRIVRSGDVIPYIDEVIKKAERFDMLVTCPVCNHGDLLTDETQTHIYCPNQSCPAQVQKKIAYFFEKLGLENFSEKMISTLKCNSVLDIYNLKKEDIIKIDGWAETSADDFIKRIEQTKKAKPEKILAALGIDNLGTTTAKLVLENFSISDILNTLDNSDALRQMVFKLIQVKGLGSKKVASIVKGLKENKTLLENFIALAGEVTENIGPLSGKSFCITGSLSKPRRAYEVAIEKLGGSNTSITSCDYLICNIPSDSAKFKKAIEKGVKIITEEQFIDLIRSNKKL